MPIPLKADVISHHVTTCNPRNAVHFTCVYVSVMRDFCRWCFVIDIRDMPTSFAIRLWWSVIDQYSSLREKIIAPYIQNDTYGCLNITIIGVRHGSVCWMSGFSPLVMSISDTLDFNHLKSFTKPASDDFWQHVKRTLECLIVGIWNWPQIKKTLHDHLICLIEVSLGGYSLPSTSF